MQPLFKRLSESLEGVSSTLASLAAAAQIQQQALKSLSAEIIQNSVREQSMLMEEMKRHEKEVAAVTENIAQKLGLSDGMSIGVLIKDFPDEAPPLKKMLNAIEREWEKVKILNQSNIYLAQNAMTVNSKLIKIFNAHLKPLYAEGGGYEVVSREKGRLNKKV